MTQCIEVLVDDVAKLMRASGQGGSSHTVALYAQLMGEEFSEFLDAWRARDEVEQFDACLDLIWVTLGYMHAKGWPVAAGWAEVARSNHAKIIDGRVLRRPDGKVLKPPHWTPPNLKQLLEDCE